MITLNDHSQAATALCATPAFLYRCSSTITAPFPSPFMATIYKPLTWPWHPYTFFSCSCRFPFLPLFPSILPLSSTPSLSLPFLTPLSLSYLEDIDDDAFLDCSHEYCGLQSDIAYSLSGIFCDALLPPQWIGVKAFSLAFSLEFSVSLIWSADSVMLAKTCCLCDIGVLRALMCCSLFLYRCNTPSHVAYRQRALWRYRLP